MKSIILLGSAPGWEKCTYDKEVWAIAKMLMQPEPPKRVDMLFNMDDLSKMLSFNSKSSFKAKYSREEFVKTINESGKPLITSYSYPEVKNCIKFPLKEITEKYGIFYFTNTICFMIAYALYTNVQSIDLWGIAQSGLKEYLMERRGVEFWLGLAAGRGIRIEIKGHSTLFQNINNELYGYKKTPQELVKEFNILEKQYDERK